MKSDCPALQTIPIIVDLYSLKELMKLVIGLNICAGNPDMKYLLFCHSKKGKFISKDGKEVACVDSSLPVYLNGQIHSETIRTTECEILVMNLKCSACKNYRRTVRLLYNRWQKRNSESISADSSHTNHRYLNTPEKVRKLRNVKKRAKKAEIKVKHFEEKISSMMQQVHEVDPELHHDMVDLTKETSDTFNKQFPEGSFQRVFWEQQVANASKKGPKQYRWHPLIIKWCLNMRLMSGASYHAMRTGGFITLPSERTLRDYSNYIKTIPGIQYEVLKQLKEHSKVDELPESKRYVTILIDEIKIKEDLVYDKHTGNMIGFVSLGSINDQLLEAERLVEHSNHPPIADHVLALMVRGLFFKFEFPLGHYPTSCGATGAVLFPIVWDAVRLVESTGLKVIAVTGDGASTNRRFFRMHNEGQVVYKTKNIYLR